MPQADHSLSSGQALGKYISYVTVILIVLWSIHGSRPVSAFAEYEPPPVLSAKILLEPDLLKGPYHRVDDIVNNDGFFNHYNVKSQFGNFAAPSTLDLRLLIKEINVIAELKKIESDETVVESVKESAESTVEGVKNIFKDPKGTLEGAGKGISSLFKTAKGTFRKREPTDAEDSVMEQLVGISRSKGEIATKYGVNVYSQNETLQDELDRLARADVAGGLGLGVAKAAIPGAGGLLLTTSETARLLNETINTTPSSKLWLQNKEKLLAMGFNGDTIELFLNNPIFSPAQHTILVTALEKLEGAANRELFLKVALQASEAEIAMVITRIAVMSAGYHNSVMPLKGFSPLARILRATNKNGSTLLFLPTDYIVWTEKVAKGLDEIMNTVGNSANRESFEIWTLGTFSSGASSQLQSMGWNIHTNAGQILYLKQ